MTQWSALALTFLIEVPIVLVLCRFWLARDVPTLHVIPVAFAATMITHPVVWWLNKSLKMLSFWPRVTLLELLVVLVEAIVYALALSLGFKKGLIIAFIANAISFGGGLILYQLIR